ncbi:hypothetical protein BDR07DRAFT_1478792 [Suillus spraguei]|nr:hypothetical protein BDR07DRAFT_1478792 [Suillus spraguei]
MPSKAPTRIPAVMPTSKAHPRTRLNNELQKIYGPSGPSRVKWEIYSQGPANDLTWHATIYINDMNHGYASSRIKGDAQDEAADIACDNLIRERSC